MTRLIGGTAGGRRLRTPSGSATRPTSDRVREALFSALEAAHGSLTGLAVLDLYAGTGALALEAASRGADHVLAVESDRRTARLIETNARETGLGVRVLAQPVARALATPPGTPYDVVLADPPYPLPNDDVVEALALLVSNGWLAPEADVVVERSARTVEPDWPTGVHRVRSRAYGETMLWYLRADRGR
jgi:16S rRNA (guanine966-N2)-methyltransferase